MVDQATTRDVTRSTGLAPRLVSPQRPQPATPQARTPEWSRPTAEPTTAALQALQTALAHLTAEREGWEASRIKAEERCQALTRSIASLRSALYAYKHGAIPSDETPFDHFTAEDFTGLGIRQVLVKLARENDGALRGLDAVRVLMRTGIIQDRRSADAQVYTILNRESEFQKVQAGEYRLVESEVEDEEQEDQTRADDLPF